MAEFGIDFRKQGAMFLAQLGHESAGFTCPVESLYYTDPVRVAQIFKTGFDLNKNGKVDAAEIEFAKGYTRNSIKLANRAYANRMGNGDEASGDGYKFRGRGPMGTTGAENYLRTGKGIGVDLIADPDRLKDPVIGSRAAAWFWKDRGLNAYADSDQITRATEIINGARTGLDDRKARWALAKSVLLA
jgi:putative chitinase